jgi:hypothetical protein
MKLLTYTPLSQILTRAQDRELNTTILEMMSRDIKAGVPSRKVLEKVESMELDVRYVYMWDNHPNKLNWSRVTPCRRQWLSRGG